jgi:RimJ/RimL family protein N-acetyltransferase
MCWYWLKNDPRTPARFFSQLKDDEPVMVDLITAQAYRGRGYASLIVGYSEQQLSKAGYSRLWTWVWHSNHPSIRTFEKCGWRYDEFLIEVEPFRTGKSLQIHLSPERFPRFRWTAKQAPVTETAMSPIAETNHTASPKVIAHFTSERPHAAK